MKMVHLLYDPNCPGCRARRALDWVERQMPDIDMPQGRFDPRQNPEAGQEVLRSMAMGVPMNIAQLSKPSKFFFEEGGGGQPKKKRKMTANGKKRAKLMSENLKIANKRGRLKNGEYRKGWGQSRIMSTAHKMTRRDMKK